MSDLFPELAKLKGGRKQAWINDNLDLIAALNDKLDFDTTAGLLHMKAGTLSRALVKAERGHRPTITKADKAMNRAVINEAKINEIKSTLNRQAEALTEHFAEDQQLRHILTEFHRLEAAAHTMMAELMSNVSHTRRFTYHIGSAPRRKVGLTHRSGYGRLFAYHGPSRKQLPGPVKKDRASHRRRFRGGF